MIVKRIIGGASAVLLFGMMSSGIMADTDNTFKGKTTSVAAFKNGLGFFIRQGEAQLNNGSGISEFIPNSALGTFWIGSPDTGVTIQRLTATEEEISKSSPAITPWTLLKLNIGKKVTVTVKDKTYTGTILAVPEDTTPASTNDYRIPSSPTSLVLLDTNQGTLALTRQSVDQILFSEKPNINNIDKERVKRLRFDVSGAKDSVNLTMGYLQKGIIWSPSYLIELRDAKTARITMQGLLMNDVEDIDDADVHFVVGYPNFISADIQSPLSLNQSVAEFIQAMVNGASTSRGPAGPVGLAQSMSNSSYGGYRQPIFDSQSANFGYTSSSQTPGSEREDLYMYDLKDVTLKKGDRASYNLFTADVPFKHVYDWEIPESSSVMPNGYWRDQSSGSPAPIATEVWHKLILVNTTKYPWTTAPAMAISNSTPIAQDMIKYTSKGGNGELKITVATDIKTDAQETEKSREDATDVGGFRFKKISVDGKLSLHNYKTTDASLRVTKNIVGRVVTASDNAKESKSVKGVQAMNPLSELHWEITLKPGEEKVLTYSYLIALRY